VNIAAQGDRPRPSLRGPRACASRKPRSAFATVYSQIHASLVRNWHQAAFRRHPRSRGIMEGNRTRLPHIADGKDTPSTSWPVCAPRGLAAAAGPYRAGLKRPARPSPAWVLPCCSAAAGGRRVSAHSGDGPMARPYECNALTRPARKHVVMCSTMWSHHDATPARLRLAASRRPESESGAAVAVTGLRPG
jgi:hypothetical protein